MTRPIDSATARVQEGFQLMAKPVTPRRLCGHAGGLLTRLGAGPDWERRMWGQTLTPAESENSVNQRSEDAERSPPDAF